MQNYLKLCIYLLSTVCLFSGSDRKITHLKSNHDVVIGQREEKVRTGVGPSSLILLFLGKIYEKLHSFRERQFVPRLMKLENFNDRIVAIKKKINLENGMGLNSSPMESGNIITE